MKRVDKIIYDTAKKVLIQITYIYIYINKLENKINAKTNLEVRKW